MANENARKDTSKGAGYWAARADSIYLYSVKQLVNGLAENANSIIDVGSAGCPYLDWFDWIPEKTSLDMARPYSADGIKSVTSDFLEWSSDRDYDIGMCLQVLEHVPPAKDFAKKLMATCAILVVSVPYKWTPGRNVSHVHDPVDEEKMADWFEKKPNFSIVVREVKSDSRRLIQVYERDLQKRWASLKQRERIINGR